MNTWQRWLGQRVAVTVMVGVALLAARSGLTPHVQQWAAGFALRPLPGRTAASGSASPWIMGLTLWVLAVIVGGGLWLVARDVLKRTAAAETTADDAADDADDATEARGNGRYFDVYH